MNKVILIGRLCADVELRRTGSGKAVASYRLAVDRQYKQEGQPEADFFNCVAWGNNGEFAGKYLHKGMKIAIEGRLQSRSYEKDGAKVYITEIIVEHHEFCEKKSDSSGNNYGQQNGGNYGGYGQTYTPPGGYNAPNFGGYSAPAAAPASDFAMLEDDDAQLPF